MKFKNKLRFLPLLITPVIALPTVALTSCKVSFSDIEKTIKDLLNKANDKFKKATINTLNVFTEEGLNDIKDALAGNKIKPGQIQEIITTVGSIVTGVPSYMLDIPGLDLTNWLDDFYKKINNFVEPLTNYDKQKEDELNTIIQNSKDDLIKNYIEKINKNNIETIKNNLYDFLIKQYPTYIKYELVRKIDETSTLNTFYLTTQPDPYNSYGLQFDNVDSINDIEKFWKIDGDAGLSFTQQSKLYGQMYIINSGNSEYGFYVSYNGILDVQEQTSDNQTFYKIKQKQKPILKLYKLDRIKGYNDWRINTNRPTELDVQDTIFVDIETNYISPDYINKLNKN